MRPPGLRRAGGAQLLLDARHRGPKILGFARPARGMDARRVAERLDAESGVVGERGSPRSPRRRLGLQRGVVAEGEAGLVGLDEAQLRRAHGRDAVGPQELADFAQLAGVMGGRDDASREAPKHASGLSVRIHSATTL